MFQSLTPEMSALLLILIIWEASWKGMALWKASKNDQLNWFVAIFLLNTVGILPIVYIKFFQKKAI
ncbi:DUF5652 family protein [Candidatus Parcubacteria bacterium]|nr:hypothetical protein [Patescibacteria group bacterium]MBU4309124.1 hypothetical protein [Patescibacteria group bacterium]MBU4432189.1 hypothetical protein [Patescibacteria group bacterium]MBU4577485.1 hypothetical protein [Patescibacteria group bacterium]MCG2697173.1 DUF5652 family protein [Candidatus Parcubacteria bacterium]